jgi:hypothetical protein
MNQHDAGEMNQYDVEVEAQEILDSHLTGGDWEEVVGVFREISSNVRWGKIAERAFPALLLGIRDGVFGDGEFSEGKYTKNGYLWHGVPDEDIELFGGEDPKMARQHLLLLLLYRKVLGMLKTKVRAEIKALPTLTPEQELDLEEAIVELQTTDENPVIARLDREARQAGEGCMHPRIVYLRRRSLGRVYLDKHCRTCDKRIEVDSIGALEQDRKKPGPCKHNSASWVTGKEGQEAECADCGKPIEDPGRFRWERSGLEPFGDDPSQDEVITLCSDF